MVAIIAIELHVGVVEEGLGIFVLERDAELMRFVPLACRVAQADEVNLTETTKVAESWELLDEHGPVFFRIGDHRDLFAALKKGHRQSAADPVQISQFQARVVVEYQVVGDCLRHEWILWQLTDAPFVQARPTPILLDMITGLHQQQLLPPQATHYLARFPRLVLFDTQMNRINQSNRVRRQTLSPLHH